MQFTKFFEFRFALLLTSFSFFLTVPDQKQQNLQRIEQVAVQIYEGDSKTQAQIQPSVQGFVTSADSIPLCQLVLDNSKSPHALLFASSSLLQLLTRFFNK